MLIRLQKYLAECGVASRRAAEQLILAGEILVNNEIITELGFKINKEIDTIIYNGKRVLPNQKMIYVLLHKPIGYVTTAKDQFNRPTVLQLVENIKERVFPVGRLDYDTSGLLILTNDGDLTQKLTHPKHNIHKCYIAKIAGTPSNFALEQFRSGITLDHINPKFAKQKTSKDTFHLSQYKTAPASIEIIKSEKNHSFVRITISEGKNRQIRKMCEAIGHPVITLSRISMGKISLGELEVGQYRFLTDKEIYYLKSIN